MVEVAGQAALTSGAAEVEPEVLAVTRALQQPVLAESVYITTLRDQIWDTQEEAEGPGIKIAQSLDQ